GTDPLAETALAPATRSQVYAAVEAQAPARLGAQTAPPVVRIPTDSEPIVPLTPGPMPIAAQVAAMTQPRPGSQTMLGMAPPNAAPSNAPPPNVLVDHALLASTDPEAETRLALARAQEVIAAAVAARE